ncbi:MAG TPA: ATP-binding protein, partial [Edaphobacter sp.]|nr:ATP-binding protein [Edaphobacter sp.]
GHVKAVIELASFNRFSEIHLAFLDQLVESMGIVLNTIAATMRTEELLKQSQALTEELQSQQEELTEGNKRLEQQARTLTRSEELLRTQQEQLQQTNAELQEKAQLLAEQKTEVERKNREVEQAKQALEEKAEQLALISKYKSEFLANMSHELRTPLNSLLILAKVLSENSEGKLSLKQVRFAETIYSAGNDLLALINDILDLSKIESGMMNIDTDEVIFTDLRDFVLRTFRHVADGKGLAFNVELASNLPAAASTDSKRLQQVLKNLLSNALKFTDKGRVSLDIHRAESGWSRDNEQLNRSRNVIAFTVSDTGIGIPEDKQKIIFEAFRQADGTTSRKYGGTGLGLSISREIARLLGGEIRIHSIPEIGSTFTLYLPQMYSPVFTAGQPQQRLETVQTAARQEIERIYRDEPSPNFAISDPPLLLPLDLMDDRSSIAPGDKVLLIVEDDVTFAPMLIDLARKKGFKAILAARGDRALAMARDMRPDAITLDIRLPDMTGWLVLNRLKYDPNTRHIPVHVISTDEDYRRGLALGADSYLEKSPDEAALQETFDNITRSVKNSLRHLLLADGDPQRMAEAVALIGEGSDIFLTTATTGAALLGALAGRDFDCAVIGPNLTDISLPDLLAEIENLGGHPELPIVIYTGGSLTPFEETELKRICGDAVVKIVRTSERLLEETAVFLNRREEDLSDRQRLLIDRSRR